MILIQAILILLLVGIGANFIGSRNSSRTRAVKKLFLLLSIPAAIVFTLFPDTTTYIANKVGVGRGADLLLYCLIVLVIFQIFDNYAKAAEEKRQIATLTRRLAIIEANNDRHNKAKS